ncbi:MAG: hypothetical protein HC793_03205 [Aquincola sp.]|nr:hypothetical protein [Aquincola sp.]
MFRSSPQPIAISELDSGAVSDVSDMWLATYGYSREEVMGTQLHRSGAPIHSAFDALNLNEPETVATIHRAYIQAGAELIETKVAPHFEFISMTRLAMGRNWRQATPDQHKALSREFRTLLVRTYTTALAESANVERKIEVMR